MFIPMEKPKDKGEVWNRVGIMLGLVDRSHEVVIGTNERPGQTSYSSSHAGRAAR